MTPAHQGQKSHDPRPALSLTALVKCVAKICLWGKGGAVSNIGDYEGTHAAFRWETPERFKFGRDVVDRWSPKTVRR